MKPSEVIKQLNALREQWSEQSFSYTKEQQAEYDRLIALRRERVKDGWKAVARYITIETGVRPKPQCEYSKNDPHKYIHTLLLCYDSDWHQLKFVKHRNTREIQHYSQYDDVSGIEEESDKLSKMYKSQEGRLPDY